MRRRKATTSQLAYQSSRTSRKSQISPKSNQIRFDLKFLRGARVADCLRRVSRLRRAGDGVVHEGTKHHLNTEKKHLVRTEVRTSSEGRDEL